MTDRMLSADGGGISSLSVSIQTKLSPKVEMTTDHSDVRRSIGETTKAK